MMYVLSLIVAVACIHASLAVWCDRPGVDCWGHDLGQETGSVNYCKWRCNSNTYPTCKSFHRKNGVCYLKDHVCKNVELRPSVGGHDYFRKTGPCDTDVVQPWLLTKYCHIPEKNCVGFAGIAHVFAVSVADCQRFCDFQPTCRSIVTSLDGHCWLKFHVCQESILESVWNANVYVKTDNYGQTCGNPAGDAGLRYCYRFGFSCHGNSIHTIPGPTTATACYNACNANPNCKSMTIHSGGNGCELKGHVCENHELRPQPQSYDVVKHSGACDDYDRPQNNYCVRADKDCSNSGGWGHDIVYVSVNFASQCQRYCDYQRDCKSIRFSAGHCWLKRHHCPDTQLTTTSGGYYYFKC